MIRNILWRHRGLLAGAAILSAFSGTVSALILREITRVAFAGRAAITMQSCLIAVAALALMFALGVGAQLFQGRLNAAVTGTLRIRLAQRFLALSYPETQAAKRRIVGAMITDVGRIAQMLLLLPQVMFNTVLILFCVAYMAVLSWSMLLLFVSLSVVGVGVALVMIARSETLFAKVRRQEDQLFADIHTIADAKKEFAFNTMRIHHFLGAVLKPKIVENGALLIAANRWWAIGESWNMALIYGSILAVGALGDVLLAAPGATVLQFLLIAVLVLGPISAMIASARTVVTGLSSVRHIDGLGATAGQLPIPPDRRIMSQFDGWREIRLENVRYVYEENGTTSFVLGPIDLTLRRGEILFLSGGNGSGKSTLALIVTLLLSPQSGRVLVDGVPVASDRVPAFQQLFSGIFPDFQLFEDVIERSGHTPDPARVGELLELLQIGNKVEMRDGRLTTLALSQGQRKRLALVQAMIDDSEILVLDEWAADQDPAYRALFYESLLPTLKAFGKTLLVISHDMRYFHVADRVVVLDSGMIIDSGEAVAASVEVPCRAANRS